MRRGTPERIFLGLAAILLVLPLLQMASGFVPLATINEKRKRFEIPHLGERLQQLDATLAADVNRWFDDRYGFRDLLIRAKNQIDYTLFRSSAKVAIGRNNWLFLRDHSTALVSYERQGEAWRAAAVEKLGAIGRYLEARGIRFIILRVAEKGDFYREVRPRDLPRRPAVTQLDKLRADLRAMPGLIYLDANEILAQAGDRASMYWRTDIHFNYRAAEILTRALVEKVAALEGRPPPAAARRLEQTQLTVGGDLGPFIAKFTPVRELGFYFDNQFVVGEDTKDGRWSKDSVTIDVPGSGKVPAFEFIYRTLPEAVPGKLPPVVMFGNSYGDLFFAAGIQTYFAEFYRARNYPERFGKALLKLPPGTKYVVYQFYDPLFGAEFPNWDLGGLDDAARPATIHTARP